MTPLHEALIKRFGEDRIQTAPALQEGDVPLLLVELEKRNKIVLLMTNGLSDYTMPVHEKYKGYEHNEIYFCLPNYWDWEDVENPNFNWVFPWIQRLAKHVVEKETWYGHGHTIPCGNPPEQLSETMKQEYFMMASPILLEDELDAVSLPEYDINFLSVIPIFSDELDYKQSKGTFKLLKKFRNQNITENLDDYRATVLKSRFRMF